MKVSEKSFEEAIEAHLLAAGFLQRDSKKHHDKTLCLDPQLVTDFIIATDLKMEETPETARQRYQAEVPGQGLQ